MLTKRKFILGSILSFGVLNAFNISTAQAQASNTAEIQNLFLIVLIGSILVGLLVAGLMAYFVLKYREGTSTPRNPIKNEFKYELGWISFAVVLAVILIIISAPVIINIQSPAGAEDAEVINIRARQFAWQRLIYFDNGTLDVNSSTLITNTNPLQLEVGKLYRINITSIDVIHSFFVYDLSFKIDAVPGQLNSFFIKIEQAGTYIFTCAEFCGAGHYTMKGIIEAS